MIKNSISSSPLKVVFMGTPVFSIKPLQELINSRHSVEAIYTQPPRKSGRGMKKNNSPIHNLALENNITVLTPLNFNEKNIIDTLEELSPDIIVVSAYGIILPKEVLKIPQFGCLNIHASILPRWRGAAPIQRSMMAGDKQTGISFMLMDEGLDTGSVLNNFEIPINYKYNAKFLHDELSRKAASELINTMDEYVNGSIVETPQENIGITWSDAKNLADASTYFGLQGYLATILSEEESVISAEQISGTGWIGASDEEREGEWKWVTGPEAGTLFWNGDFNGGPAPDPDGNPYYSNWNNNEPNNSGNEDYAHITDNSVGIPGSWNDLPNAGGPGVYEPKGYIVEYGGTPGDPVLNISTSTSIFIPEITAGLDQRNCTGGSVTLTASVTEGDLFWYDQPNGGTLIFTGNTFTTPVLNSSKTYYLDALPIGCDTNQRIAIEAIIDTTPIVINTPPDINRCDEDRDGFLDFDLQDTPTVNQVLNGLDPILNPDLSDFEVLYFDNLSDAELNTTSAIITNPYRVNTSTNPTIFARIHNGENTSCFTTVEFKLKVTDTPTPTQPSVYRICDDSASGSDIDQKSLFLLNTKDAEILATVTNPGDYFISYHTDLADAQTSSTSNAIDKNSDYEVTLSQRVYVRIENIDNVACNTVSDDSPGSTFTSFELIVDPLPVITDTVELKQCDDDTDGFSFFNLNEAASDISTNYLNETFVFYPSLLDAENDTDAYSEAEALVFENRTVTADQVWARAISSENCYRIAQVDIIVSTTGLTGFTPRSFSVCDDFLDIDGNDTANNDDNDGAINIVTITIMNRKLTYNEAEIL